MESNRLSIVNEDQHEAQEIKGIVKKKLRI